MAKKKTLKQRDFVKKKLKVGRPKKQCSDITKTSCVAKTIHLPSQVKFKAEGSLEDDVLRRLSLCKHHNSTTRKETLIYFHELIPELIHGRIMSRLMASCIPLICDEDKQVRVRLLRLIDTIGNKKSSVVRLHLHPLVLFINNAMTHMAAGVQCDSTKFLQCVMKHCGDELVRLFWIKILKGLFNVLGCDHAETVSMDKLKRLKGHHLEAFTEFIRLGCLGPDTSNTESCENYDEGSMLYSKHIIPQRPNPYAYLKLFKREFSSSMSSGHSSLNELDHLVCEDLMMRRKAFIDHFASKLKLQFPFLIKEAGNCGRSAAILSQVVEQVIRQPVT